MEYPLKEFRFKRNYFGIEVTGVVDAYCEDLARIHLNFQGYRNFTFF